MSDQQPRQIDSIVLSTFALSRSIAGLVPSNGPFIGMPLPRSVGRAVPSELVPGAPGGVPSAPPIVTEGGECDSALLRATARPGERSTAIASNRTASTFMLKLPFVFSETFRWCMLFQHQCESARMSALFGMCCALRAADRARVGSEDAPVDFVLSLPNRDAKFITKTTFIELATISRSIRRNSHILVRAGRQ
jgi:hypothetical protein